MFLHLFATEEICFPSLVVENVQLLSDLSLVSYVSGKRAKGWFTLADLSLFSTCEFFRAPTISPRKNRLRTTEFASGKQALWYVYTLRFVGRDVHSGGWKIPLTLSFDFDKTIWNATSSCVLTCSLDYIHQNANRARQIVASKRTHNKSDYRSFYQSFITRYQKL